MSEGKQPDRISKKRTHEMMAKSKPRKFDIIGELQNYGEMTGGNISREILSYLDFSTLQRGRLVSKSWNGFLSNDKKIWQDVLKKQLPNLIHFTNKLAENEEENSTFWKEVWSSIEKKDNISPKKLFYSFKKVQSIFEIVKICANSELKRYERFQLHDYLPFEDDFTGEKVKKEIRREIRKKENLFIVSLQQQMRDLEEGKNHLAISNISVHRWLPKFIRGMQEKLLREIKKYLLNE